MSIKIIVNGAAGKMGSLATQALKADPRFDVVAALGRADDLSVAITAHRADVVLDLTRADVGYKHALQIIEAGARPVIGTSGFTTEQVEDLTNRCAALKRGGLVVPNFSIGVLCMMHFAKQAAAFFETAEIIEVHHPQKFDAPSSTAKKTAEMIAAGRSRVVPDPVCPDAEARGLVHMQTPIHALRLPGVLADQTVVFGGAGETLSIHHHSADRQCFMPGVLLACSHVMSLSHLLYGLEDVIFRC